MNRYIKSLLLISLICSFVQVTKAQINLRDRERKLISIYKDMTTRDTVRYRKKNKIMPDKQPVKDAMLELLSDPNSFTFNFDSLRNLTYHRNWYSGFYIENVDRQTRVIRWKTLFIDSSLQSIIIIQRRTADGRILLYSLDDDKAFFDENIFTNRFEFYFEGMIPVKSQEGGLYLLKTSQWFDKNHNALAYCLLRLGGNSLVIENAFEGRKFWKAIEIGNFDEGAHRINYDTLKQLLIINYMTNKYFDGSVLKTFREERYLFKYFKFDGTKFIPTGRDMKYPGPTGIEPWYHYTYQKLRQLVKDDIDTVEHFNYWRQSDAKKNGSESSDFDIDSMAQSTALEGVKLLEFDESRDTAANKMFELSAVYNGTRKIRIYNFYYESGGTRGGITHPIIQWDDSRGKLHGYNFSTVAYSSFSEIHKLRTTNGDELYLLIGNEQGNSSHTVETVYTIQFRDDKLVVNYPAFVFSPMIEAENTGIAFNDTTQVLSGTAEEGEGGFSQTYNDTEISDSLLDALKALYSSNNYFNGFILAFNGRQFINKCMFVNEEMEIMNEIKSRNEVLKSIPKDSLNRIYQDVDEEQVDNDLEALFSRPGTADYAFDTLQSYLITSGWYYNSFRFITWKIPAPVKPGTIIQFKNGKDSVIADELDLDGAVVQSAYILSPSKNLYLILGKYTPDSIHTTEEAFVFVLSKALSDNAGGSKTISGEIGGAFSGKDKIKITFLKGTAGAVSYNPQTMLLTIKQPGKVTEELKFNGDKFMLMKK